EQDQAAGAGEQAHEAPVGEGVDAIGIGAQSGRGWPLPGEVGGGPLALLEIAQALEGHAHRIGLARRALAFAREAERGQDEQRQRPRGSAAATKNSGCAHEGAWGLSHHGSRKWATSEATRSADSSAPSR